MKVTGYSLAQTKRLIRQYAKTGKISVKLARSNGFKRVYTETDIRLLAAMDERHGQPSGAVLKKLCERAHKRFDQSEYQQLADISVSHLYNLRASKRKYCVIQKSAIPVSMDSRHPASVAINGGVCLHSLADSTKFG
ncbi:MAG: hypothetical protein ACI945_000118 [Pseudohongiellaceae bacterium]|jgi:hypothetical protein